MPVTVDENTEYIISSLESAGFSAYAVGGCVRDKLLGREVNDFDITTSALPHETKEVFKNHTVIETGIKHGTITVIIDRKPYEITTFRVESGYEDCRHPDKVSFVRDVESDLARRDFTVNAIAFSPCKGIVDPFGGIVDLHSGIIRAVGDPYLRFSEDALRILRALRFSATLGFDIEPATSKAILSLAPNLSKVSSERIYEELKKLVCGKNAVSVLEKYHSVLETILPINGEIEKLFALPEDCPMRFACLFGDSVDESLGILKADNHTKSTAKLLALSSHIPDDIVSLKKYISKHGRENSLLISKYRNALYSEDNLHQIESILNSGDCLFLNDLEVNGKDLMDIGIKGKDIGNALSFLLSAVIEGKVSNNRESLLQLLKNIDNSIN